MKIRHPLTLAALAVTALVTAGSALAHAHVLPEETLSAEPQLFTLTAENEKDDASTTKVVLTVPEGFVITRSSRPRAGRAKWRRPARARRRA